MRMGSMVYIDLKFHMLIQGLFYPSLGAEFQPHSQSKIVTFFPIPCLIFSIKKSKIRKVKKKKKLFFFSFFFLKTPSTYEKQ